VKNIEDLHPLKELQSEEMQQIDPHRFFLLDVRKKEAFAQKHFFGSINLPLAPSFISWAPILIACDLPIILILQDVNDLKAVRVLLQIVGLDNIKGYYQLSAEKIDQLKDALVSFPLVSPQEALALMKRDKDGLAIIDVRTTQEWRLSHVPDATLIELPTLENRLSSIPKEKKIGVICGSGYRASAAASILEKNGFKDVFNVLGGMQEWTKAQLPLITGIKEP
jgi:hydroxyacylglutathione hydrolase